MNIWRFFNYIFGWHYVWVNDCKTSYICKVVPIPFGRYMGKIVSRNFFINTDGSIQGGYYISDWFALTEGFPIDREIINK